MIKVAPMHSTPKLRYDVQVILIALAKTGVATTCSPPAFRYLSNKLSLYRDKNQIWFLSGNTSEKRNGINNVIVVNPDYVFEKVDDFSFDLKSRY